jgi:hypothetical protein
MMRLAITPEAFQAAALAWLTTITVVAGAAIAAILTIMPKIAALRQSATDNSERLDDHSRRITENAKTVTDVALKVDPKQTDTPKP